MKTNITAFILLLVIAMPFSIASAQEYYPADSYSEDSSYYPAGQYSEEANNYYPADSYNDNYYPADSYSDNYYPADPYSESYYPADPYYDNGYSGQSYDPYYSNNWTPGCGNACVGPTSSAYGMGGTQGYGSGWGMPYSNYGNYRGSYGYTPVYGIGGTNPMYASAAMPMYQQPQYMQPTYQQPVQNTQWTWGMVTNSPVVYGKSIGTSVPLFGTYPSCVIYFLPTASPYTHGLRWSGISIAQATMSYVGQVTGEGYMEVPYDGREYSLTVWNQKGETTTCSTR